jgi:hypothetical protein
MSGIARKLAERRDSLNIFLLSMCRKEIKNENFEHL